MTRQKATLCTKTSHDVQIIKVVPPVFFAQLTLVPNSPKSYALQCFTISQTHTKMCSCLQHI